MWLWLCGCNLLPKSVFELTIAKFVFELTFGEHVGFVIVLGIRLGDSGLVVFCFECGYGCGRGCGCGCGCGCERVGVWV